MKNTKRNFDADAATWDDDPRRVQIARELVAAIRAEVALKPSMNVLDFGCGTGLVTLQLSAQVRNVTGVDSSQGMLDVLQEKATRGQLGNVKTQRVDLDKGDVLQGTYDLAVSTMTLHHVRDIAPLLEQFAQVVRPGGHVCIADLDLEEGDFHANNDGVHHFGFDRAALRASLATAGFEAASETTAAKVLKPGADGQMKQFPIFLITACRA